MITHTLGLLLHFSTDSDIDFDAQMNVAPITFSVGATQGSVECADIAFIDDDITEELECFVVAHSDEKVFIPVCIEDNDGRL